MRVVRSQGRSGRRKVQGVRVRGDQNGVFGGMTAPFAAVLAFAWAAASPALAQVLEIQPDGSVRSFSGPAVHSGADYAPIEAPRPVAATIPAARIDAPAPVAQAIAGAAGRYELSPDLIAAVAWQESRFRHGSVSAKGAQGVMQLMPATAAELGVDPDNLGQNVVGGTAYLAQLLQRYRGDVVLTLAAYNAGPGAVDRHGGVPPYAETRRYVAAVLERMAAIAADRQ